MAAEGTLFSVQSVISQNTSSQISTAKFQVGPTTRNKCRVFRITASAFGTHFQMKLAHMQWVILAHWMDEHKSRHTWCCGWDPCGRWQKVLFTRSGDENQFQSSRRMRQISVGPKTGWTGTNSVLAALQRPRRSESLPWIMSPFFTISQHFLRQRKLLLFSTLILTEKTETDSELRERRNSGDDGAFLRRRRSWPDQNLSPFPARLELVPISAQIKVFASVAGNSLHSTSYIRVVC